VSFSYLLMYINYWFKFGGQENCNHILITVKPCSSPCFLPEWIWSWVFYYFIYAFWSSHIHIQIWKLFRIIIIWYINLFFQALRPVLVLAMEYVEKGYFVFLCRSVLKLMYQDGFVFLPKFFCWSWAVSPVTDVRTAA
jgi:hypothetical protein